MKRLVLVVAILALVFPTLRQAEARTDISIDFFYDNLGDGGSWIEVGDYGYCWQPSVAVSNTNWRPYSDGYWAYTDVGWTWVSYEDFGWATYHYGRWMRIRGRGWVWVPGREWGPAWVSWRTGGDYVGWAPLPPRRAGDTYAEFSPINARVDIDFDIGPAYYNFIDVRYIGEPVLRERIFAADQNVTYITKTVNVTNITYTNNQVHSYGPDYNTLSRYSTRPIQKLSLQRETNVDPAAAAQSKSLMKVQGDKLVIAAPQQFQKPTKNIAPKVVKEKVTLAQAPVERGWEPVGDQKAQTELKEKMKKEDPKSVPPPTVRASEKAATSPAGTSPSVSVPAATTPAPPKDKGKNKQRENVAPSASVPPATGSTETTPPSVPPKAPKEKSDKRKNESAVPSAPEAPKSAPRVAPPPTPDTRHKQPGPDSMKPEAAVEKPKHEAPADITKPKKEPAQERVAPPPAANAPANPPPSRDEGKKKDKGKNEPATSPTP
jgi:hypothetical protein